MTHCLPPFTIPRLVQLLDDWPYPNARILLGNQFPDICATPEPAITAGSRIDKDGNYGLVLYPKETPLSDVAIERPDALDMALEALTYMLKTPMSQYDPEVGNDKMLRAIEAIRHVQRLERDFLVG